MELRLPGTFDKGISLQGAISFPVANPSSDGRLPAVRPYGSDSGSLSVLRCEKRLGLSSSLKDCKGR